MTLATAPIETASFSGSRPRIAWTLGLVGCVIAAHWHASMAPAEQPSPWVLASHLFALVLLGGLLWLGAALGVRVVRVVGAGPELGLETLLFALGLGLGGVAYLVLAWGSSTPGLWRSYWPSSRLSSEPSSRSEPPPCRRGAAAGQPRGAASGPSRSWGWCCPCRWWSS